MSELIAAEQEALRLSFLGKVSMLVKVNDSEFVQQRMAVVAIILLCVIDGWDYDEYKLRFFASQVDDGSGTIWDVTTDMDAIGTLREYRGELRIPSLMMALGQPYSSLALFVALMRENCESMREALLEEVHKNDGGKSPIQASTSTASPSIDSRAPKGSSAGGDEDQCRYLQDSTMLEDAKGPRYGGNEAKLLAWQQVYDAVNTLKIDATFHSVYYRVLSVIQSTGYGKTKACVDLARTQRCIYINCSQELCNTVYRPPSIVMEMLNNWKENGKNDRRMRLKWAGQIIACLVDAADGMSAEQLFQAQFVEDTEGFYRKLKDKWARMTGLGNKGTPPKVKVTFRLDEEQMGKATADDTGGSEASPQCTVDDGDLVLIFDEVIELLHWEDEVTPTSGNSKAANTFLRVLSRCINQTKLVGIYLGTSSKVGQLHPGHVCSRPGDWRLDYPPVINISFTDVFPDSEEEGLDHPFLLGRPLWRSLFVRNGKNLSIVLDKATKALFNATRVRGGEVDEARRCLKDNMLAILCMRFGYKVNEKMSDQLMAHHLATLIEATPLNNTTQEPSFRTLVKYLSEPILAEVAARCTSSLFNPAAYHAYKNTASVAAANTASTASSPAHSPLSPASSWPWPKVSLLDLLTYLTHEVYSSDLNYFVDNNKGEFGEFVAAIILGFTLDRLREMSLRRASPSAALGGESDNSSMVDSLNASMHNLSVQKASSESAGGEIGGWRPPTAALLPDLVAILPPDAMSKPIPADIFLSRLAGDEVIGASTGNCHLNQFTVNCTHFTKTRFSYKKDFVTGLYKRRLGVMTQKACKGLDIIIIMKHVTEDKYGLLLIQVKSYKTCISVSALDTLFSSSRVTVDVPPSKSEESSSSWLDQNCIVSVVLATGGAQSNEQHVPIGIQLETNTTRCQWKSWPARKLRSVKQTYSWLCVAADLRACTLFTKEEKLELAKLAKSAPDSTDDLAISPYRSVAQDIPLIVDRDIDEGFLVLPKGWVDGIEMQEGKTAAAQQESDDAGGGGGDVASLE
eukprot:gene34548-41831_t